MFFFSWKNNRKKAVVYEICTFIQNMSLNLSKDKLYLYSFC